MKAPTVVVQVRSDGSDEEDLFEDAKSKVWIANSLSTFQESVFIIVLLFVQFFAQAAVGQTICILPIIKTVFNIDNPGELSWLVAGYSLTVGSFILISGRLGDYFGHKSILIGGIIWYTICSVLSGLSVYASQYLFILARVLCGIGPSVCIPNALAILGRAYAPGLKKNIIFSLYGGLSPIGFVLGAIISAIFAELVWWPWSYWMMSIVAAAVAIAGFFAVPSTPSQYSTMTPRPSIKDALWDTDIPAGLVGIASLIFFNITWNQAVVASWAAPYIPVFLVLSILFAVAFFYMEVKISTAPLIPFKILTGDVGFVLVCVAAAWGGLGAYLYYYWVTILNLDGIPPIQAATWFIPPIPVGFAAAILSGYLITKLHPAILMVLAELFVLVACTLLATYPPGQAYWPQMFPSLIFAPMGLDLSFPAAILILSNAVGRKNQGMAMSLVNTIVNYSQSIALGIAGTIEQQVTKDLPEGNEKILAGYRGAEYFGCAIVASGLILSLVFLWRASNRGGLKPMTEKTTDVEVI